MMQKSHQHNNSFLISAFWIPLLALPIISLTNNQLTIEPELIPKTYYENQLNYFDHRNAVISYWDTIVSQTVDDRQALLYLSDHKSNRRITININEETPNETQFNFKLNVGESTSNWSLSNHTQAFQLPRVHKSITTNFETEQTALQNQLNWREKLNWAEIDTKNLPGISKLITEISRLQHNKNSQNIALWCQLQNDIHKLIKKFNESDLLVSLDNYLSYQKALLLLEIAAHLRPHNLINMLQIIISFNLLDSLVIDGNDFFSLSKAGLKVELSVLIEPDKSDNYSYLVIDKLCKKARSLLKKFDLKASPWQYVLALARSYQLEMLNPDFNKRQRANFKSKIEQLISPNNKSSIAKHRNLMHPDGADYRINDQYYTDQFSRFSQINKISLKALSLDKKNSFSDSVQTVKFNNNYYVIDTYNRDCYKLNHDKFVKFSRLPHDVSPLAQATIQPDPLLGQPRVFIFGGFPSSNVAYASTNLKKFSRIKLATPIEGRFYFGMSQFISNKSGMEMTVILGGTRGYSNDLARFQDAYSSVDGSTWVKLNQIDWSSRHSFGLTQLNNTLLAFGGCRSYESSPCFNEIWSSINGENFKKLANAPWEARGGMAYALSSDGLFMFGGANQTQVFSDLWMTSNGKDWKQISISTIGSVNSQLIITENDLWIIGGKTKFGRYAPTRSFRITRKALQFM